MKYTGFDPQPLPDEVERAISAPHDQEGEHNKPLWIIWKADIGGDGLTDGPQIDSIADTIEVARFLAACVLDEIESRRAMTRGEMHLHIERVPANHRFGMIDLHAFREMVQRRSAMKRFRS